MSLEKQILPEFECLIECLICGQVIFYPLKVSKDLKRAFFAALEGALLDVFPLTGGLGTDTGAPKSWDKRKVLR